MQFNHIYIYILRIYMSSKTYKSLWSFDVKVLELFLQLRFLYKRYSSLISRLSCLEEVINISL